MNNPIFIVAIRIWKNQSEYKGISRIKGMTLYKQGHIRKICLPYKISNIYVGKSTQTSRWPC